MAYYEMFTRDSDRFRSALERIEVNPLGSAALAGTTFAIDRADTAAQLGMPPGGPPTVWMPWRTGISLLEFMAAASIAMVHFSRLSEELVLWATSEFNFIELPDAFATGSSIMPQKKNPDVPELIRGKAGRVFWRPGGLVDHHERPAAGLQSGYAGKTRPRFSARWDTLQGCITIMTAMLPRVTFKKEVMRQATRSGFLNADGHGRLSRGQRPPFPRSPCRCGARRGLRSLPGQRVGTADPGRAADLFRTPSIRHSLRALDVEQVVNRRTSEGGTASTMVEAAIKQAADQLAGEALPEAESVLMAAPYGSRPPHAWAPLPPGAWARYWP